MEPRRKPGFFLFEVVQCNRMSRKRERASERLTGAEYRPANRFHTIANGV